MADIGKERGLGAIDLGQRLGALPLGFIGAGTGDAGGNLRGDQIDEAGITLVQRAVRIQCGNQHAGRPRFALLHDRHCEGAAWRRVPGAGRKRPEAARIFDDHVWHAGEDLCHRVAKRRRGQVDFRRRNRVTALDSGHAGQPRPAGRGVEQPGSSERNVALVVRQCGLDRGADFRLGAHGGKPDGQFAQRCHAAFADDPFGILGHDAQHAADRAVIIRQRTVGEGVVGFLGIPAAFQEQQQPFIPGRHARAHHRVDARTEFRHDLRPNVREGAAKRPGMFGTQRRIAIGVVVEEDQLRSPAEPHGIA